MLHVLFYWKFHLFNKLLYLFLVLKVRLTLFESTLFNKVVTAIITEFSVLFSCRKIFPIPRLDVSITNSFIYHSRSAFDYIVRNRLQILISFNKNCFCSNVMAQNVSYITKNSSNCKKKKKKVKSTYISFVSYRHK